MEPVLAMSRVARQIDALLKIHPKGYDLSLSRIEGLLDRLGNPQNDLPPVIHVAGTNGKGSTIAFARAILEAAGLACHVDTSPHLVNWHERFRLAKDGGGELVDDDVLADAIDRVAQANDAQPITVFEILTAAMFVLFSEHPADACLIEVGLGGRFDCTNVMADVAVSVITPVSMDHEMHLGDTLAKIAFEKAGIIRAKTPLVCGPQEDEALAVIERQCARHKAPLSVAGEHFHAVEEAGRMVFQDNDALLDLSLPRLPGRHQISNAGTAIEACRVFARQAGFEISEQQIDLGLRKAHWPGRLQRLGSGPLANRFPPGTEIWVDGGHNPDAASAIATFFAGLNDRNSKPLVMICGMLNTKNPSGYFRHVKGLASAVFTVPLPSSDAGIDPRELADACRAEGLHATACHSLDDAIEAAALTDGEPRILISGSLYIAGDALAANEEVPQ